MRLMGILLLALSLSVISASSAVAQPVSPAGAVTRMADDFRFAPPEATMVGSIHVSALLESPLIAQAIQAAGKSGATSASAPSTALPSPAILQMAMGLLGQIREMRFAIMDSGPRFASLAPAPGQSPTPDFVALISGKVDDGVLGLLQLSAGSAAAVPSDGKEATPAAKPPAFRRLDPETILFGTEALVASAAARLNSSAPADQTSPSSFFVSQGLLATGGTADLLRHHDLWLSGKLPDTPLTAGVGGNLRNSALGLTLPGKKLADGPVSNGLLEIAAEAANSAQAQSLLTAAQALASQQPQWSGLMNATVDGAVVHIKLQLPNDGALDAISAAIAATQE